MFQANLLPGHGFQQFTVYKPTTVVSATGRAMAATGIEKTDVEFLGILTSASQNEKDQWKQNGHPITHKIVEYGAERKADTTDYLVNNDGRQFYIRGYKNPGDLNITMIYFVEERLDVKKKEE